MLVTTSWKCLLKKENFTWEYAYSRTEEIRVRHYVSEVKVNMTEWSYWNLKFNPITFVNEMETDGRWDSATVSKSSPNSFTCFEQRDLQNCLIDMFFNLSDKAKMLKPSLILFTMLLTVTGTWTSQQSLWKAKPWYAGFTLFLSLGLSSQMWRA